MPPNSPLPQPPAGMPPSGPPPPPEPAPPLPEPAPLPVELLTPPVERPPVISQPGVAPSANPARVFKRQRSDAGPSHDLLEPGESLVSTVRRHPIGIIGYYLEVLVGLLLIIGFFVFLTSTISSRWVIAAAVFALVILIFFLFVSTYVYRQNRLLVTDRSLVQILQKSLFIRKVSRLSLSNVEDVNAESRGILASIFGYGTLTIQTAGALENFIFPYCPNPTFYADQIIEARQRYAVSLQEEQSVHPADHAMRGQS